MLRKRLPDGTHHHGGQYESFRQNYRRDSKWDLMKSSGHLFTTTQFCVRKFTSSPRSAVKHHPHEKRSLKGTTQLFLIVPNFARPPPHNRHQFLINFHCAGKKRCKKVYDPKKMKLLLIQQKVVENKVFCFERILIWRGRRGWPKTAKNIHSRLVISKLCKVIRIDIWMPQLGIDKFFFPIGDLISSRHDFRLWHGKMI